MTQVHFSDIFKADKCLSHNDTHINKMWVGKSLLITMLIMFHECERLIRQFHKSASLETHG